ncbi:hypothetical protein [Psychrobacillus sp. NPDC096389]|uniref:hypothetical protein n=1 Tax=Psychrobacillus sp. NPDC096389 TaxID=3364490 RepID=UPI0037F3452B
MTSRYAANSLAGSYTFEQNSKEWLWAIKKLLKATSFITKATNIGMKATKLRMRATSFLQQQVNLY